MSLKTLCSITLLFALGWAHPLPAWAQSSIATEAYNQGQYGTAFQLAHSLAEQGDAEAQVLLGRMYAWGRGVPRNQSEAAKWFRKAAEQGHGLAQSILGLRYAYGRGMPEDHTQAIEWFRRGTKRGNPIAQHNLGVMYENGQGIPKDDEKAANWYRLAAEQGIPHAQSNLGRMYSEGRGVEKDDLEAVKWFRKAAELGLPQGMHNLGIRYLRGEGLPQDNVRAYAWIHLATQSNYRRGRARESRRASEKLKASLANRMTTEKIKKAERLSRKWQKKSPGDKEAGFLLPAFGEADSNGMSRWGVSGRLRVLGLSQVTAVQDMDTSRSHFVKRSLHISGTQINTPATIHNQEGSKSQVPGIQSSKLHAIVGSQS
jgi:TPR repeat protein